MKKQAKLEALIKKGATAYLIMPEPEVEIAFQISSTQHSNESVYLPAKSSITVLHAQDLHSADIGIEHVELAGLHKAFCA